MATSWSRIALLYAIGVLAAGQLGIVPPLVPALQRDLGLSLEGAGIAVSIVTLMGAVLGLPAGRWCQAVGHARALGFGLLIMAAAAVLGAVVDDGTTFLAIRGVAGIGYLLVAIAAPSQMAAIAEPRHHAFALSLWGTFVPVGIALAGLAAASAGPANWRLIFAVDGLLLASAWVVHRASPRVPTQQDNESAATLDRLWVTAPLAFAFFCFALLFLAVAGMLPSYLVDHRAMAEAEAGRIVAFATACAVAGSLAAAPILRRGTRPGRLVAAGTIASVVLAAISYSAAVPLPWAVAGFALSFALGGVVPAAAFAAVPRLAAEPRAIGPINGLIAQAGSLGSLTGPPLLALWVGWTDWALAPVLLLAIAALGAAAALMSQRS
jgi:MFS family permease